MKSSYIIGIDEVGRGPIAGPVAVCAFICKPDFFDSIEIDIPLRDSKKLTKNYREKWFEYLNDEKKKGNCDFAVSMVSAEWVDRVGIVRSIQKALDASLGKIITQNHKNFSPLYPQAGSDTSKNSYDLALYRIFLDGGLKAPKEYINQETVTKGDELHPVISCASIVAKVSRDNIMANHAKDYPNYGFDKNSGYGTKAHYDAIKTYGQTTLHRKTFIS